MTDPQYPIGVQLSPLPERGEERDVHDANIVGWKLTRQRGLRDGAGFERTAIVAYLRRGEHTGNNCYQRSDLEVRQRIDDEGEYWACDCGRDTVLHVADKIERGAHAE
jgi:hypothetical protein